MRREDAAERDRHQCDGAWQGIVWLMVDKSKCIFTACALLWVLIKYLISGKRLLNKVGNCGKLKCHQGVAHFCFHNRKASQCRLF